jgi:hypothetical protein
MIVASKGQGKLASLLVAVSRLWDVTGELHPLPDIDPAAAMREDWTKVGDDLRRGMREAEAMLPTDADRELVEA